MKYFDTLSNVCKFFLHRLQTSMKTAGPKFQSQPLPQEHSQSRASCQCCCHCIRPAVSILFVENFICNDIGVYHSTWQTRPLALPSHRCW